MSWAQWAQNDNLSRDKAALQKALREVMAERDAALKKAQDCDFWDDQSRAHHAAEKALRIAAMNELDKACGGADKNPLRKQAYTDPDAMRIPSGDRKGEVVTKADHIYLTKFADFCKQNELIEKWNFCKNWKEFLRERISY